MRKHYILITLSLLASLFIYVFYRTEKTVVNEMIIAMISRESYYAAREIVRGLLPLQPLIVYSVPEGLWVFCITLTSKRFYLQVFQRKLHGVYIPMIICVVLEILQLLNITNGRFDVMDILVSFLFWWLAKSQVCADAKTQNMFRTVDLPNVVCAASYTVVYLAHVVD